MTASAQVPAEVQVRSPAQGSGLKDMALLQLQLRFDSWPRNGHMPQVQPFKKHKNTHTKKTATGMSARLSSCDSRSARSHSPN